MLKERLHPGKDAAGRYRKRKNRIDDEELKEIYATKQPYGEWLDSNLVELKDLKIPNKHVEEYAMKSVTTDCRKPLAIPMKSISTFYP